MTTPPNISAQSQMQANSPRRPLSDFLVPILMILAGTALFLAIAADVVYHGRLQQVDEPLRKYLHTHATPTLVTILSLLSGLGNGLFLTILGLAVGGILIYKRSWRSLSVWAAALLGSAVICEILKSIFKVPRPMEYTFYAFGPHAGYSFPSGHTMGATIVAGALVLLAWNHADRSKRAAMLLMTLALSLIVAFGLLYIGVHALTEVLAAQAISLAWLGILRLFLLPQRTT